MKLFSDLKIGPKVWPCFGFDALMFSECIEFGMEACQKMTQLNFDQHSLFTNLAIIHRLKLIHQDIKPLNIMWSPSQNKIVFIDFGFCTFLKETVGQKVMTTFRGSINYCSKEMTLCCSQKKARKVDLYYNDLVCLNNTIDAYM